MKWANVLKYNELRKIIFAFFIYPISGSIASSVLRHHPSEVNSDPPPFSPEEKKYIWCSNIIYTYHYKPNLPLLMWFFWILPGFENHIAIFYWCHILRVLFFEILRFTLFIYIWNGTKNYSQKKNNLGYFKGKKYFSTTK